MIYTCEDCNFTFSRVGEVDSCPFCEKKQVRAATQQEAEQVMQLMETQPAQYSDQALHKQTSSTNIKEIK
ncbi:MAG: hypothetical protein ACK5MV_04460 [Aminipila sp.]